MPEIVYARVNSILEDEFSLLQADAARTPITGKVQADFTITLSRGSVAGISTVGITITEIGGGKYALAVPATAFVATTGLYCLRLYIDISGQAYVFEGIYAITSDGTPSGTSGIAEFLSATNNGRVTDGSSALPGATVYIRDPTNVLYTQTLTNISGNWVAYFETPGVYTVFAQLSGYQQATATITVAGSTATLSPASDIALTSISTGSGLLASELTAYARRMALDRTGSKADIEVLQSVNMAIDMVSKSKDWPKYVTKGNITLNANYQEGTLTLTQGSNQAILTGGIFPTWAGMASLFAQGLILDVLVRVDDTTLTLAAPWAAATVVDVAYNLFNDRYALPDDLSKFGRLLPGQSWPYGGVPVGPDRYFEVQMLAQVGARGPTAWAFVNDEIRVYPYPTVTTNCGYWFYRRPTPLVGPTDEADFDVQQIELLRRAIDYQIAILYGGYAGGTVEQALARYQEALGRAAPNDKSSANQLGVMQSPMWGNDMPLWLRRTT